MSSELAPPFRENISTHQCRCVLVHPLESAYMQMIGPDGRLVLNGRCANSAVPDSPFCEKCDDRHPAQVEEGWIVTVWTGNRAVHEDERDK